MWLMRLSLKSLALTTLALMIVILFPASSTYAQQQTGVWTAEYFDNMNLEGPPVYTEVIGPTLEIESDYWGWQWENQHPELVDEWSTRFTMVTYLAASNYQFGLSSNDGARMYINGLLILDQWEEGTATWYQMRVLPIPSGTYVITVEYCERYGTSSVAAFVEATTDLPAQGDETFVPPGAHAATRVDGQGGGPPPADGQGGGPPSTTYAQGTGVWTAEYFGNMNLEGVPVFTAIVGPVLDFDNEEDWGWGWAAEHPELEDEWSARFTMVTYLAGGNYRFGLNSDDGSRMYINGQLILDLWKERKALWFDVRVLPIPSGTYTITVEYYDHFAANALAAFVEPTTDLPTQEDQAFILTGAPMDGRGGGPMPTTPTVPTMPLTSAQAPAGSYIVDEGDSKTFIWSGSEHWLWTFTGYAGMHVSTPNRSTQLNMWGRWNHLFPRAGYYDVYVYIPGHSNLTTNARYRVYHDNILSAAIPVNQAANQNQWFYLGTFYFQAGGSQYVYLNNLTFENESMYDVAFDAVAFVHRE